MRDSIEETLKRGHPPIADGVVLVDFDGTLFAFGNLFGDTPPLEGAVEALKSFREEGLRIVIFTSRLSNRWLVSEGYDKTSQIRHIESLCHRYGIPWDEMTAEKIPCIAYIDDKAIRYENNWDDIKEFVIGEHRKHG